MKYYEIYNDNSFWCVKEKNEEDTQWIDVGRFVYGPEGLHNAKVFVTGKRLEELKIINVEYSRYEIKE